MCDDKDKSDQPGNDKIVYFHFYPFGHEGVREAARAGARAALNGKPDLLDGTGVNIFGKINGESETPGNNVDEP